MKNTKHVRRVPIVTKSMLTLIKTFDTEQNKQGRFVRYGLFRCECGNEKRILVGPVKSLHTQSCGCKNKHGMKKTPIYRSWSCMLSRCTNKKLSGYKNYGGRGITVCKRWYDFKNFYEDMGDRPKDCTLDRIDNDKGYCKENCRWATLEQQSMNKRNTIMIKGKSLKDMSRKLGVSYNILYHRHKSEVEQALSNIKAIS